MASSSRDAAAVDPAAQQVEERAGSERAGWEGSDVSPADIAWLRRSRRIPEEVECRILGDEIVLTPEPGEHVVFLAHFERGFALPASDFTRKFLDFFGLLPHHLPANAILTLSAFVTCCEAYSTSGLPSTCGPNTSCFGPKFFPTKIILAPLSP